MLNLLTKKFDILILFSLFLGGISSFFLYQFSWAYEFCGEMKYVFYFFASYVFLVLSFELFFLRFLFLLVAIFKYPDPKHGK